MFQKHFVKRLRDLVLPALHGDVRGLETVLCNIACQELLHFFVTYVIKQMQQSQMIFLGVLALLAFLYFHASKSKFLSFGEGFSSDESFEEGYDEGYESESFEEGYEEPFEETFEEGYEEPFEEGFEAW